MPSQPRKARNEWYDCYCFIIHWAGMYERAGDLKSMDAYSHCAKIVKSHMPKPRARRKK